MQKSSGSISGPVLGESILFPFRFRKQRFRAVSVRRMSNTSTESAPHTVPVNTPDHHQTFPQDDINLPKVIAAAADAREMDEKFGEGPRNLNNTPSMDVGVDEVPKHYHDDVECGIVGKDKGPFLTVMPVTAFEAQNQAKKNHFALLASLKRAVLSWWPLGKRPQAQKPSRTSSVRQMQQCYSLALVLLALTTILLALGGCGAISDPRERLMTSLNAINGTFPLNDRAHQEYLMAGLHFKGDPSVSMAAATKYFSQDDIYNLWERTMKGGIMSDVEQRYSIEAVVRLLVTSLELEEWDETKRVSTNYAHVAVFMLALLAFFFSLILMWLTRPVSISVFQRQLKMGSHASPVSPDRLIYAVDPIRSQGSNGSKIGWVVHIRYWVLFSLHVFIGLCVAFSFVTMWFLCNNTGSGDGGVLQRLFGDGNLVDRKSWRIALGYVGVLLGLGAMGMVTA